MTARAIRVDDLVKIYPGRDAPVTAVDHLSLEVTRGECFGLLGPNGAGKTTTVEILEGLTAPTSGEVEVLGRNWKSHEREIRERIGVTLQETKFPEKATLLETLQLFRSFFPVGPTPEELLARVSLQSKSNAFVETLSGGQKQRLAVALALVGEPELIFLDEPTNGLDPQSRLQLQDVIRKLQKEGRTTVLTTHYMDEAERVCDRVAIVDHGRVIALGTPRQLIREHSGEHLLEFELDPCEQPPAEAALQSLPGVIACKKNGDSYQVNVAEPHQVVPRLLERMDRDNLTLARLSIRPGTLEDVFVKLTGRHLRDDDENDKAPEEPKGRRGRRARR